MRGVPRWWLGLTQVATPALMRDLLRAVEQAGVSPNDRAQVEHIWQSRQIARALARQPERGDAA
jgi:hypothetical protein